MDAQDRRRRRRWQWLIKQLRDVPRARVHASAEFLDMLDKHRLANGLEQLVLDQRARR